MPVIKNIPMKKKMTNNKSKTCIKICDVLDLLGYKL